MRARGRCVALALASLLLSQSVRAEGTDDLQALLSENVISTASTTAEKASTAPATSVTISSDELRTYGIRTIAEAINFLSVGLITSDPLRTPDIGSRGVLLTNDDGKHFLLLVNGHAINDPLYGAARFDEGAGIPMDIVDHIEVVIGPGSVLYGSNAMLGVINVITKTAREYEGGHVTAEYEPGRTRRAGAGAGFAFHLFGEPGELTASAEYVERFGPDLHFQEQQYPIDLASGKPIAYRRGAPADGIWGGTVRDAYFMQAPSGIVRMRVGDFELNVVGSLYRRGIPYSTQRFNVDLDDPDSYEMDRAVRLDLKHQATLSRLVELSSRAYADSFDYQRQLNRNALYGCFRSDFTTCAYYDAALARWLGVEERLSFNWFEDASFVTVLGVDARMRWVRAKQDAIDFETGAPFAPTAGRIDDTGGLVSPYVQQTWSPASWLDLNAGARLDADARFSPIVSPRGAVAITPFRKTTFRAIYSQAFRAPTWIETDSASYRQAPSQNLNPEVVRSGEASIEQRFSKSRLLVGVFRSAWENLVEQLPLSPADIAELERQGKLPIDAINISQYRNVSSLTNYGYNAKWDGTLSEGKFGYGVSVTEAYTRREVGGSSEPLVVSPQLFGNAHVSYAFGGYVPTPALAAYYVGERPIDRSLGDARYDRMPPAPALAEIRATLTGEVPALRGFGYRLSAAYATAASGPYVAGPGAQRADPATTQFPVTPIDRFRIFLGLRYDFGGDTASSGGVGGLP